MKYLFIFVILLSIGCEQKEYQFKKYDKVHIKSLDIKGVVHYKAYNLVQGEYYRIKYKDNNGVIHDISAYLSDLESDE